MSWCCCGKGPQTQWLVSFKQAFLTALQADEYRLRVAVDLMSGEGPAACLTDSHVSTQLPALEGAELLCAVGDIRTLIPCVS